LTTGTGDALVVDDLTKIFNKHLVAVDHVSFKVKEGEIFGFLGPNGAGKTTTINMLITVLKPNDGGATVCGFDIARQSSEVRNCIGVVPQEYTADEDLTGWENCCALTCTVSLEESLRSVLKNCLNWLK
jgi:ABC-2 type transport system ATP-binding protein